MMHDDAGAPLDELDVDDCLRLLASSRFGRLAVDDGRGPLILPVNYLLDAGEVLIRTGRGTKLDQADRPDPVCFEVDHLDDQTGAGWSVVMRGRLQEVSDPDELERVDALGLTPAAAGDREHVVRVVSVARFDASCSVVTTCIRVKRVRASTSTSSSWRAAWTERSASVSWQRLDELKASGQLDRLAGSLARHPPPVGTRGRSARRTRLLGIADIDGRCCAARRC
jgi:uncharacterized protein